MTIEIAKIKGVSVVQDDDGRVHWTCGSAVDADGSNGQNGNPFAYRTDNKGLDLLANAGFPDGGWQGVLLDHGDGTPTSDGNENLYSQTTYAWKGRPITTRFVDHGHTVRSRQSDRSEKSFRRRDWMSGANYVSK